MAKGLSGWRHKSLQPWIALLISIALSFLLMATSNTKGNKLARERTAALLSLLARPFGIFPAVVHLAEENARLRSENTLLRLQVTATEEAFLENQRLRRLLDFKERSLYKLKAAEVMATNPLPDVHSLLINVGKETGLRKDQAVINDLGLIGKLAQVGDKTSVVELLLDRNLGVAVRFSHCRVNGITSWAGGGSLLIDNVPASAPVRIGEQVNTSGLDGVFPIGVPVGVVTRTEKIKHSIFLHVEVKPFVDFSLLEEVFVVINEVPAPVPP